jgi:hypothetical protein
MPESSHTSYFKTQCPILSDLIRLCLDQPASLVTPTPPLANTSVDIPEVTLSIRIDEHVTYVTTWPLRNQTDMDNITLEVNKSLEQQLKFLIAGRTFGWTTYPRTD